MKRSTFVAAVAAAAMGLVTVSSMAWAQRGPGFDALDADGNGEVSLQELNAHADARFEAADTNGDGFLSAEELIARGQEQAQTRAERMMQRVDANQDGKLSQAELQSRRDPARMLQRVDTNGNGTISRTEFDAARDRMQERRADRNDG